MNRILAIKPRTLSFNLEDVKVICNKKELSLLEVLEVIKGKKVVSVSFYYIRTNCKIISGGAASCARLVDKKREFVIKDSGMLVKLIGGWICISFNNEEEYKKIEKISLSLKTLKKEKLPPNSLSRFQIYFLPENFKEITWK